MRLSRISLFIFALLPTIGLSANIDPQPTIAQLNLLISQYELRIKQLEAENSLLRKEMAKAGIKIPLADFSGAIAQPLPTSVVISGSMISTGSSVSTGNTSFSGLSSSEYSLNDIVSKYGQDVANFISRIHKDWSNIQSAYTLPQNSRIGGYEFVQTGSLDHVFVDIVTGTGATGAYDIKILYQFEKKEYKRKLIGIFDYNPTLARYNTRTGTNPFGGVPRIFVRDPYFTGASIVPPTASSSGGVLTSSGTNSGTNQTSLSGVNGSSHSITLEQISQAYAEKRYLTTISLSNTYLTNNKPTKELLSIRYRTYFIIGKYTESLDEIAKIEALGALDRQTACNAQVIATYSKNQSLIDKYTKICKQ